VGGDVVDVFYRRSLTGGTSWEDERRLNDDTTATDQWNPAIAVTADGYVAASWYDRRLDQLGNLWFDRFLSTSRDDGVTWSANIRVSDVSSPVSMNLPHIDVLAPCYHGDYDQIVVTGPSPSGYTAHVVWSDDRRVGPGCVSDPNSPFFSSCPNPDVYYDDVRDLDADGAPDSIDGCPTVIDAGADVDLDGVDDACDTCKRQPDFNNDVLQLGPNPVFTGNMTNRTTVSGQVDDDADGIGNHCDFDYNNAGAAITSMDFNDMKFSLLPNAGLMTQSNCGATAAEGGSGDTQRCGEFDHDGLGAAVSSTDFNKAKLAIGGVVSTNPWDKMSCGAACTPPLSAPIGGPGQVILGKAICTGVGCP
jgi:hypothetical protein